MTEPGRTEEIDAVASNVRILRAFQHGEEVTAASATEHWPEPLEPEAFQGVAGRAARVVDPVTEGDQAGVLTQFLTGMGNLLGRNLYRTADGARHHPNLNTALVGGTSSGRKGSSWAQVKLILEEVDEFWARDRIQSGLSSGEGLIWHVRDPIEVRVPIKPKGRFTGEYATYESDPGVCDKRLLVVQTELAATLKVASRDGNTLSPTMREAWDGIDLRTMTKNSPAHARGAHISIIAHTTPEELHRHLDSTEMANGFANRFLWVSVKRSKILPFGEDRDERQLAAVVDDCRRALAFAQRNEGEIEFDIEARDSWSRAYPELTKSRPGLLGAIVARAPAQVLRLAVIYAILDCSRIIGIKHLKAAVAVWEYSVRSAEHIFGDALGDPDADSILIALRSQPAGLRRNEIVDLFGRHLYGVRMERALNALLRDGLARFEIEKTAGRSAQRWRATQKKI
jgi:hypothetical protein